ncbi:DUF3024 domain-containing protein [Streptomyces mirabilis]|uniref:DUF3024 domain-containing protein n=1 Tax=Streptomyces mirabilis TaxID=68239 RepID=UPI0036CB81EC
MRPAPTAHRTTSACPAHRVRQITEERAPWDGVGQWTSRRVARLWRTDEGWQVDGADRNGRWYPCDHLPAVPSLEEALTVLDDPRHAFWG